VLILFCNSSSRVASTCWCKPSWTTTRNSSPHLTRQKLLCCPLRTNTVSSVDVTVNQSPSQWNCLLTTFNKHVNNTWRAAYTGTEHAMSSLTDEVAQTVPTGCDAQPLSRGCQWTVNLLPRDNWRRAAASACQTSFLLMVHADWRVVRQGAMAHPALLTF